jgi:hypothetical protein
MTQNKRGHEVNTLSGDSGILGSCVITEYMSYMIYNTEKGLHTKAYRTLEYAGDRKGRKLGGCCWSMPVGCGGVVGPIPPLGIGERFGERGC